ncbi:replication licensing factor Cdt1 [Schizosaccharomyces octosporus yFS286]|uniref:Replication licensing factor Cdt1 n=1 Tax=Schizosaccharomyces octosporus (strain yFS286) TaxID=483514 RepID=S9RBP9_SCHOY|nr:replication licensing factor Cdt1 [Schizosaccharomyces octosporus yFS286]EPX71549.1 replication licensing factor Cdt1 [Schizosaccharomyces octosporus yFS286]
MRAGSQTTLPFSVGKVSFPSSKRKVLEEHDDSNDAKLPAAPTSSPVLKRKAAHQETSESLKQDPPTVLPNYALVKHPLESFFSALDICWSFHISINTKPTFQILQPNVSSSIKLSFHLSHLAQILTIWPEAYRLRPCISTYQGHRVATYELQPSSQKLSSANTSRIQEFHRRLVRYFEIHPQAQNIPESELPPLPSLNQNNFGTPSLTELFRLKKTASPKKVISGGPEKEEGETDKHGYTDQDPSSFEKQVESSVTPVASKSSLQLKSHGTSGVVTKKENPAQLSLRQSSLFDRVRKKQKVVEAKKIEISKKDPVLQKLSSEKVSLVRIIDLIFVQLSTWPSKRSFSMTELVSSIQKSLSCNTSSSECIDMVQLLASTLPSWCSIHYLGNVQVVTFTRMVQGKPYLRSQILSELNQKISQ